MPIDDLPEVVRSKALAAGAHQWLEGLPELVARLEDEWSIRAGRTLVGGTEAHLCLVHTEGGGEAVLKLVVPRDDDHHARNEIRVLELAGGEGCVRLLRSDASRGALLLERLGPSMADLGLPLRRRHELLCDAAMSLWRPQPDADLPTGADKGRWLADFIPREWEETGRPCSERSVEQALRCAERRIAAHDDERAVLVHGDVHQWNALRAGDGFKLIDPDGLLAEAEYDLGILMREDPVELARGDARERARRLGARSGCEPEAIFEWGVVERVSTGLLCTRIGLQPVARQMLELADRLSAE